MIHTQSFSYSNAGVILADLELEVNDNQTSAGRVLATQNDSNSQYFSDVY